MSAVKSMVLSVLAWVSVGSLARADSLLWSSGGTDGSAWTNWNASNGSGSSSTTIRTTFSSSNSSQGQSGAGTVQSTSISEPTIAMPSSSHSSQSTPGSTSDNSSSSSSSTSGTADAFINFSNNGSGPEAGALTTGGGQAWYLSPSVEHVFGAVPTTQQQNSFEQTVLQDVQKTFSLSGLNPVLTLDANSPANHTLSVVSGTSYGANPSAIGITDVGSNGFSFIDKLSYGNSVQDLAWALAHNISHELMHAFGVAVHHDQTGNYLDAASASWSLLTSPNTTFSQGAANDIAAHNMGRGTSASSPGAELIDGDQEILLTPTPEPATLALWSLTGAALYIARRRRHRVRAAA